MNKGFVVISRCIIVGLVIMAFLSCDLSDTSTPAPPVPSPPPDPMDRAKTLSQAIAVAKPAMNDTLNEISPGGAKLAMWCARNMKWSELSQVPATKYGLVMKDPDRERGKRLCIQGSIIEIHAENSGYGKLFHGGIWSDGGNIYRFIAVGSTGELVERSRASFCGVVIGTQDYSNSAGGMTHAVFLVGMFGLPENKQR